MAELLLASGNPGKVLEIRELLNDANVKLLTPADIGLRLEVEESGATYQENASLKAQAFARASGFVSLADDSGLEVDVLGGQPGLHSARFDPQPGATDADRRAALLQKLAGIPAPWRAQFRCVVALAKPEGKVLFGEGICPGEIIVEERGEYGFGYDPIFLVAGMQRTMAELTLEEKNRLSHRARAIHAIRPLLLKLLDLPGR